jgi:hypothetical protein
MLRTALKTKSTKIALIAACRGKTNATPTTTPTQKKKQSKRSRKQ